RAAMRAAQHVAAGEDQIVEHYLEGLAGHAGAPAFPSVRRSSLLRSRGSAWRCGRPEGDAPHPGPPAHRYPGRARRALIAGAKAMTSAAGRAAAKPAMLRRLRVRG